MENNISLSINSVQLNIVIFVDVWKAINQNSLEGAVYMMDNSIGSEGQGTTNLQTVCKQAQVLNWIIYPMDVDRRPDGSWPPFVRISNIVFLDDKGDDVSSYRICDDMRIYGGVDKVRTAYTPVYYYWAGVLPAKLETGIYRYRLILELEGTNRPLYLNLDGPSLQVMPI